MLRAWRVGELYARGPLWTRSYVKHIPESPANKLDSVKSRGRVRGTTASVAEELQLTQVLIEIESRLRITQVLMTPPRLKRTGFHLGRRGLLNNSVELGL
jgi:hypothetical protein